MDAFIERLQVLKLCRNEAERQMYHGALTLVVPSRANVRATAGLGRKVANTKAQIVGSFR
jgi:hypothetical protein